MSNSNRSRAARSFRILREDFWPRVVARDDPDFRRKLIAATLALVAAIGFADFLTGVHLSLLVFYFLPVSLAVAAAGWRFGCAVALLSVAIWMGGDFAAGAHFANPFVPVWNGVIALGTYLVLIWLLSSVLALQREVDERVRQRTAALTEEIAERERLERAVIEIGERERRSVGRDLHDGLGQHLTGTALVAQALAGRLAARGDPEAAEARKVAGLVEEGIEQTRQAAKGLVLGEVERDSLPAALRELAESVRSKFRLDCESQCASELPIESPASIHLFRIAQEAVTNAARHGRARRIVIRVKPDAGELELSVSDDGRGLPQPAARGTGLGLRIMAHRAAIIGGRFSVETRPGGGTMVSCRLPIRTVR